jgi:hypothetical protein
MVFYLLLMGNLPVKITISNWHICLTTRGNKSLIETYCRIKGVIPLSWSVTVTRQILPLDSQLDNSDVVDNFNLDYFDDDHIPLSGTIGSSST